MATEERECPLCMEPMEADDMAFYPCDCQYQVCRFCWAKIINEENGLCPACRKEYNSEKPALFKPLVEQDDGKQRANRKRKEHMKKNRLTSEMLKLLPELRVVQPNLIFVVGLPPWVCKDKEVLKGQEYFGRYGKVFKVEINQNQTFGGPQGQPSFSAYITFYRAEDAMRSIRESDQGMLHGRSLRVSLGTTKYCSQFLRGSKCTKHECMYLHELGDPAASFTKEEMQAGKHTEYMNKLLMDYSVSSCTPTSCSQTGSNYNNNHMPNATNSSDEYQRPRTRDGPVSPRIVSSLGSGDLSSSPCSSSSVRQPEGAGTSPLKFAGLLRSATTDHQSITSSDSSESRKITTFSGGYVYPQFSSATSTNTNIGVHSTQIKDSSVPLIGSDDASRSISWIPSQLMSSTAPDVSKTAVEPATPIPQLTPPYINGIIDDMPSDSEVNRERIHPKLINCQRGANSRLVNSQRHANAKLASVNSGVPSHMTSWYRSNQGSEGSSSHNRTCTGYGDEPVDLGFDPFRESQQGLAELLAAELDQLGLRDENSQPLTRYEDSTAGSINLPGSRQVDSADHSRPVPLSWSQPQVGLSVNDESDRLEYSPPMSKNRPLSLFTSRLYPPPGFERSAQTLSALNTEVVGTNSAFSTPQIAKATDTSDRLVFSSKDHHVCQGSAPTDFHDSATNGSISGASTLLNPCLLDRHGSATFPSFGFHPQDNHGRSHGGTTTSHESVANSGKSVGMSPLNDSTVTHQQEQQQQAMAHLFAAAYNTASAMLNNNRQQQQSTDDKPSTASNSSPLPFDLNAFFSQLYRQSPFLFSNSSPGVAAPFLSNGGLDWLPSATTCGRNEDDDDHMTNGGNTSSNATHTIGSSNGGAVADDGGTAHTSPASVVNALSTAAVAAAAVLFPSVLPFAPRQHNDYSSGHALPPGLVRPPAVLSNPNTACPNFHKMGLDNHHEYSTGTGLFTSSIASSVIPSAISSAPSAVMPEHVRSDTSSLTWQLDDPAIVSSQLSTKFWQGDSTVQQLFDQHLLHSSVNYINNSATVSRTPCQPQQIRTPTSSTSLLRSATNTTESTE